MLVLQQVFPSTAQSSLTYIKYACVAFTCSRKICFAIQAFRAMITGSKIADVTKGQKYSLHIEARQIGFKDFVSD